MRLWSRDPRIFECLRDYGTQSIIGLPPCCDPSCPMSYHKAPCRTTYSFALSVTVTVVSSSLGERKRRFCRLTACIPAIETTPRALNGSSKNHKRPTWVASRPSHFLQPT